uniref:BESS domain-containing protein n=1 Tax=Anabas testudineus TaxID=64144 RepID=A0A7N6FFF1_ANATE
MDDKLILAVFNYPELYNVTLPNYRCTESRASAWRNISIALGLSCECVLVFSFFFFCFIPTLALVIICSARRLRGKKQGEIVPSRWKYRQLMNFIAPFTGSRSGGGETISSDQPDVKPQVAFVSQQDTQMAQLAVMAKVPSSPQNTSVRKTGKKPRDEDELFLLSFVPALKRLAPQKRCETKIKIQQIMYEAEFNVAQPEFKEKPTEQETQD